MPQSFRLRLGDGTILMVDHGGLSTWETDPTAAVGTKNPNKWIPLKEFLIQERAEAFRRAREGVPEEPPADTPATVREDGLPLIPPPSREDASDRPELPSPPEDETPLPSVPEGDVSLELPAPAEEPAPGGDASPGDLLVPEESGPPASLAQDADGGVSGAILPEPAEPAPAAVIEEKTGPAAQPSEGAHPVPIAEEIDLEPLAAAAMTASPVTPSLVPADELPVIPLRPQEDETPSPPAVQNDPRRIRGVGLARAAARGRSRQCGQCVVPEGSGVRRGSGP